MRNPTSKKFARSTIKVALSTCATSLIAVAVLAQPANNPSSTTVDPPTVTVTPAPGSGDFNWGMITAIVAAAGGLITAVFQGRNSSMSLQVTSIASQQERLDKGQEMVQAQMLERINGYRQDLIDQKELEKELRDRLDKLDQQLDNLTRENIQLEGKVSRLETENSTLKLLLDQSKQIQAKADINPPQ